MGDKRTKMGNLLYCMCDGLLGRGPGSRELPGLPPAATEHRWLWYPCSTTFLTICLTDGPCFQSLWSTLRGFKTHFCPQREFSVQFSWRTLYTQTVLLTVHVEWANADQYALIQSKPHDHTYVVFSKLTNCLTHHWTSSASSS